MPTDDNAILAGWDPDWGETPFTHGTPPDINPDTGNNGVKLSKTLPRMAPKSLGGHVDWVAVAAEMQREVGFREGPSNANPWGPEQGVSHASYCNSFADIIPYHHEYRWWPESQFKEKGSAYVPYTVKLALAHGEWMYDTPISRCDTIPGDRWVFVWPGGDGAGDHIETVFSVNKDGSALTYGANTGRPQGVWVVHRDRKYLLGRHRPSQYSNPNPPTPPGGPVLPGYEFTLTKPHIVDWVEIENMSWIMTSDGAIYASPGTPGVPGVNGQPYWIQPTHTAGPDSARKAHIRQEGGRFVSCVQDSEGKLFRPDGGADFTTH